MVRLLNNEIIISHDVVIILRDVDVKFYYRPIVKQSRDIWS